ncbi:MAG: hypothetical protein IJ024_08260 [Lachnospiraceae bacterium]|nr:hypothetical protein [Lachnospiraceae bacterium]
MTVKDFLNFKKPHFWVALVAVAVLAFAGVVSVLDKEEPVEQVEVPPAAEVTVEVEEEAEEPEKTESQIIMERFQKMDWEEVKENAKAFGDEGWEEGIVVLAENSYAGITLYGYNDADYQYRGVAVDHDGNVNYFDWVYTSSQHIQPQMYWDGSESQLQITLNVSEASEINVEELHVLVEHDTKTMEDFVYRSSDYLMEIEEQMNGTGVAVGSYVDIKLGEPMMLQFEPVKTENGQEVVMKLHQAVIHLNPSKDGFAFELGDIGVEPEKRTATIELEGTEETYTEIQYTSENGYTLWYPENLLASTINGHEGFTNKSEPSAQVILVPEGEMDLDDSYLKEAAANYKSSGEYKKVTVSKVKKLTADSKDVTIKMIEVVHDGDADRFYIVKGKDSALLITASMTEEALEGWGERINAMIQTITFAESEKASE